MLITDLKKPIIYNMEKSRYIRAKNNVVSDKLKLLRDHIRVEENILNNDYFRRKVVDDSGFYFMDKMYFRNSTVRKVIDTIGKTSTYIQRRINSRYNDKGRLQSRTIEESLKHKAGTDFYYYLAKSIEVLHPKKQPAITKVRGRINNKDFEKVIQKGKPSIITTTENKFCTVNGSYKIVSEKTNYAHLNKSPLRSTETLYNEFEATETKKVIKKVVEFKDGTKLQTGEHNGQPLLVEIPHYDDKTKSSKGARVIIYKTQKEIDEVLKKYDKEVREFLS